MADDDAAELERVLGDLKRQLPEGHALAAIIADEELDFEQLTELTLDDLREVCIVHWFRLSFRFCRVSLVVAHGSVLCECSSALSPSRRSLTNK